MAHRNITDIISKKTNSIFVFVHFYFCDITDSAIFNFLTVVHQS